MKKRILAFLLVVMLTLSVIPAVTAAEQPADDETIVGPALEKRSAAPIAETAHGGYPMITGITPSDHGVTIRWTAWQGAYKYYVFIKQSATSWKIIGSSRTTSFEHRLIPNGTSYTYTVRAADRNSSFVSDCDRTGRTFACLPQPVLKSVKNVNGGQRFEWNPVRGAVSYCVFLKSGSRWIAFANTRSTSYLYTGAVSGKSYTYSVRCRDASFALTSTFDHKGLTAVYYAAPRLSFAPVDGGISIRWNAVPGASRYCVLQQTSKGWKRIGYSTGTSYDHTGLKADRLYIYTVRCVDKKGNYLSYCQTENNSFRYIAPPRITKVAAVSGKPSVTWQTNKRIASYKIDRKAFGGKWVTVGKTARGTYIDRSAKNGGIYTYTVTGLDRSGKRITRCTYTATYYRSGVPANGSYTINGSPVSFSNGKVRQGYVTIGKKTYYFDASGKRLKDAIVGSKKEGYTYADKNGVCITTKQVRLAAEFIVKHGKGKTLSERAGSAIIYMKRHYPYRRSYNHPTKKSDLPALATDMFYSHSGNCFRYATSFAYMIKIAGYRVKLTVGTTAGSPHGWLHIKVGSRWIMCDNRIVGMSRYHFPDFTGYTYKLNRWRLKGHFTTELVFTENGKAVWK